MFNIDDFENDTFDAFEDARQDYITDWDDEQQQWMADAWETGNAF
jgi:hypothetical protein